MYKVGDYVVCPGHGVGRVHQIEVLGDLSVQRKAYYDIRILANGMKVKIPTDMSPQGSIRGLVTSPEILKVFDLLKDHDVRINNATWNRRQREYETKVKTGSLLEIADVLRSLFLLKDSKALSDGERRMMARCKELLVKEIAISQGNQEHEVSENIDACFSTAASI